MNVTPFADTKILIAGGAGFVGSNLINLPAHAAALR
jgi:nucleoside-diphosphate-sugar epimerase